MTLHVAVASLVVALALAIGQQAPPSAAKPAKVLLHDGVLDPARVAEAEALGADRWLQVNQDEASYSTGIIDAEAVLRDVGVRTSLRPPPWAMLDFETPFFENLRKPAGSPERRSAVQTMKEALAAAKRRYPQTKWSFYGLPNLPFWVDGQGWTALDASRRDSEIAAAVEACREVLADADWVSVSVYDYYDPKLVVPGRTDSLRGTPRAAIDNGIAWRRAQMTAAKGVAAGRPVIPLVCPFWAPGGIAPACRLIPPDDFIDRQVAPCLEGGADGIALWTGYAYRIDQVQSRDPEPARAERGFGRAEWRNALTADLLDGAVPPDWSDGELRRTLVRKCSSVVLDRLARMRRAAGASSLSP